MINFKDKKTIFYICFALAYVVAFALASVYDFRISQAIADIKTGEYYSDNLFGRVFAVIGEMPVYAVSSFAVSVFYANVPETYAKKMQIFLKALCLAITFGVLFFGFNRMFKNISNLTNSFDRRHVAIILAEVFLAAAVTLLVWYVVYRMKPETKRALLKFAFVAVVTCAMTEIIVHGIKFFWGRTRFRTIAYAGGDADMYTAWYLPQGKRNLIEKYKTLGLGKDAFASFPSGHSCSAATLITLFAIPKCLDSVDKTKKRALYSFAVLFTAIVMFSRLVMGAHYLSDVLAGTGSTILSYIFSNFILKKIIAKYNRNGNES